jgi:DNA-directed RNA polymerase sigma subunit (sigma70/sigma32)
MSVEQRLLQLENNQKQIVNMIKQLLNANNNTAATVRDLAKRVAEGEKLDAKQQAVIEGLKGVSQKIEEVEKVIGPSEVIPQT